MEPVALAHTPPPIPPTPLKRRRCIDLDEDFVVISIKVKHLDNTYTPAFVRVAARDGAVSGSSIKTAAKTLFPNDDLSIFLVADARTILKDSDFISLGVLQSTKASVLVVIEHRSPTTSDLHPSKRQRITAPTRLCSKSLFARPPRPVTRTRMGPFEVFHVSRSNERKKLTSLSIDPARNVHSFRPSHAIRCPSHGKLEVIDSITHVVYDTFSLAYELALTVFTPVAREPNVWHNGIYAVKLKYDGTLSRFDILDPKRVLSCGTESVFDPLLRASCIREIRRAAAAGRPPDSTKVVDEIVTSFLNDEVRHLFKDLT